MALDWQCSWCGDDLPDHRLHTNTCSHSCAKFLMADEKKRAREAGTLRIRVKKRKLVAKEMAS